MFTTPGQNLQVPRGHGNLFGRVSKANHIQFTPTSSIIYDISLWIINLPLCFQHTVHIPHITHLQYVSHYVPNTCFTYVSTPLYVSHQSPPEFSTRTSVAHIIPSHPPRKSNPLRTNFRSFFFTIFFIVFVEVPVVQGNSPSIRNFNPSFHFTPSFIIPRSILMITLFQFTLAIKLYFRKSLRPDQRFQTPPFQYHIYFTHHFTFSLRHAFASPYLASALPTSLFSPPSIYPIPSTTLRTKMSTLLYFYLNDKTSEWERRYVRVNERARQRL